MYSFYSSNHNYKSLKVIVFILSISSILSTLNKVFGIIIISSSQFQNVLIFFPFQEIN
ncbi:MAG: hypothetical protein LBQ24_02645 [Candidatus Peribacteria bacterium]|nr:hypothetical protein [Candidatus Peribacteria bacterium]